MVLLEENKSTYNQNNTVFYVKIKYMCCCLGSKHYQRMSKAESKTLHGFTEIKSSMA